MTTQSQSVLLEALKASQFDSEVCYPKNANWSEIINEAKAHTVMGLISPVVPVQDESSERCKVSYMRIMYEQDRVVRLLDNNNIPFVVLKGSSASIYYPKPYLRVMGDIDVLIPKKFFIVANNLFKSNGYVLKSIKDGAVEGNIREIEYVINGISIELHRYFSSPGFDIDDILEAGIERREYRVLSGYAFPVLPEIENGLVLIAHINQHLKNNGIGLRQIVDWEMYLHSIDNVELWESDFVPLAESVGLLTLSKYITRMCNMFLGLPETFAMCEGVDDSLVKDLLEAILADGNFGLRSEAFNQSDDRSTMDAVYKISRYGVFRYFTDIGFSALKLNKSPWLKPLAFFCGVIRQFVKGINALLRNKNVRKQIGKGKKRYELYKALGVRIGEE